MRPLIKAFKGMLAVSFIGGCRLAPVPRDDAGAADASVNDGTTTYDAPEDVDSSKDAGKDSGTDSSADAFSDAAGDAAETDAADAASD